MSYFKILLLISFCFSLSWSQDANSTLGIPEATTTQILAITGANEGSMMYSNTENVLYFFNGTSWETLEADNLGNHFATQNIRTNGFWLSGDSDNEGFFIDNAGNVGVGTGTFTPERQFHVAGTNGGIRLDRFGNDAFFFFVNKDATGANVIYNWAFINDDADNSFQIRNYGTDVGGPGLSNTMVFKTTDQIQIPAYGTATTFDDNNPSKILGVTDDGSIVQSNVPYEKIVIWAEEGAEIGNGAGNEWSFGNSATGTIGIPLPEDWEAYAVSLNSDINPANASAEIAITNSATGTDLFTFTATAGGNTDNMVYTEILGTPTAIAAGTSLGVRTVSVTNGPISDVRVAVFLRRRP